jgi:hypothetical protein
VWHTFLDEFAAPTQAHVVQRGACPSRSGDTRCSRPGPYQHLSRGSIAPRRSAMAGMRGQQWQQSAGDDPDADPDTQQELQEALDSPTALPQVRPPVGCTSKV